jgi:hypothetical protein
MQVTSNIDAVSKSLEAVIVEIERKLKAMTVGFAQVVVEKAISYTKLGDGLPLSFYTSRANRLPLKAEMGFARGSWRYSESSGWLKNENYGAGSGEVAASKFRTDANNQYKLGDKFYISNTGFYIEKIQSRVNAAGILPMTVQELMGLQGTFLKQLYNRG